jgi:hypothetical protein
LGRRIESLLMDSVNLACAYEAVFLHRFTQPGQYAPVALASLMVRRILAGMGLKH